MNVAPLIEYAAALASLICVWLTVRQNVWCWPIGIIGTVLYTWVFFHAKLYSDTGLQVIFTVLQFYGWWLWVRGGKSSKAARPDLAEVGSEAELMGSAAASEYVAGGQEASPASDATRNSSLRVTRLRGPSFLRWGALILVGTVLLGRQMSAHTDAALPYVDAFQTVMSLAAQYLMGFKVLESWVLWILVDVVSVGMYWSKGLYVTMGLYAVFLWMAAMGWHAWYRELKARRRSESDIPGTAPCLKEGAGGQATPCANQDRK